MVNKKFLHILGTDTGVGKTQVTGLLLKLFKKWGQSPLPLKPIHSGWEKESLWGEDLELHRSYFDETIGPQDLCAYPLKEAISPHSAAFLENKEIDLAELKNFMQRSLNLKAETFLVEGIGGVLCPIAPAKTYLDFLKENPHPIVLVARAGLGTLNHSIMSCKILESEGMAPKCLVLNNEVKYSKGDLSVERAKWELEHQLNIPILGPLENGDETKNLEILETLKGILFKTVQ